MDNSPTHYDQETYQNELKWLKERRKKAGLTSTQVECKETIALALSGGGIRSATFNLGVIQALTHHDKLKHVDYMSSVSGGGYIASSLTWFKSQGIKDSPFGSKRTDHHKFGGNVLSWFRSHASFLTPGNGINNMSLITAIATGSIINMLIVAPILVCSLYLAMLPLNDLLSIPFADLNGFKIIKNTGLALIPLAFLLMLFTALSTHRSLHNNRFTEKLRRCVTRVVSFSILLLTIGIIPDIHQLVSALTNWLVHASLTILSLGLSMVFLVTRLSAGSLLASVMGYLGLLVASLGILMLGYHVAKAWLHPTSPEIPDLVLLSLGLSLLLSATCNINLVSMHGYYRNRLRDAFLPYRVPIKNSDEFEKISTWEQADLCQLANIPVTEAPYPIINCNIELPGSSNSKYRNREGDCFTFTPLWTGSDSTGGAATSSYMNGTMDLATATAISGAAVATNTKNTRSKPLNFLMAFFNLRLGCWLENPRSARLKKHRNIKPLWYLYMFRDMFGQGLNEKQAFIHLSDGGHFENLGIYELIRRKSKLIIATDAGADPNFEFGDLARLTELIRVDFGAKLTLDFDSIIPNEQGISRSAYAVGKITYADGSKAILIYLKSTIVSGLSPDILGYKNQHPSFPDQSTVNQFFDEPQFEAYRELGFQLTHALLKEQAHIFETKAS